MLRFEDELREEDLIFAFINQESAHFFDFWTRICVRRISRDQAACDSKMI